MTAVLCLFLCVAQARAADPATVSRAGTWLAAGGAVGAVAGLGMGSVCLFGLETRGSPAWCATSAGVLGAGGVTALTGGWMAAAGSVGAARGVGERPEHGGLALGLLGASTLLTGGAVASAVLGDEDTFARGTPALLAGSAGATLTAGVVLAGLQRRLVATPVTVQVSPWPGGVAFRAPF